jgi:universal stress protein A
LNREICREKLAVASRFQHILIPVDFTEKNQAALDVVFDLAQHTGARVTLLHVIERVEQDDDPEMLAFYQTLEERAREHLAGMTQRFLEGGVSIDQGIVYGRRGPEIVRYSVEHQADLIVLSSHRIDPTKATRDWATLSYQVSILCQCPVLLVK